MTSHADWLSERVWQDNTRGGEQMLVLAGDRPLAIAVGEPTHGSGSLVACDRPLPPVQASAPHAVSWRR